MLRSNSEGSLPTHKNPDQDFFQVVGDGVCIAYHGNSETIIFPNYVKELSNYLFFSNHHIKEVHLPKNLHTIGAFTFAFCTQLKEITIPDTVKVVETSAFYFCHQLKSVLFSPLTTLTFLGDDAFLGTLYWEKIQSFKTKNNHPELFTFTAHILLMSFGFQKIYVPDGIKSLYAEAFSGNTDLTHIKLPSSVEYLGTSTFEDCLHLTSVTLSENLTTIPPYCFRNCRSLRSITLPNGIKRIGKGAFEGCHNLKKVIFPESLEVIDRDTFNDCPLLSMPIFEVEESDYDDNFDSDI